LITCISLAQDVTGYPTLKFFKSGVDEGIKYRGQRDLESLSKYVEEQMGRGEQKDEEVAFCKSFILQLAVFAVIG
jgi:hypothetical protein